MLTLFSFMFLFSKFFLLSMIKENGDDGLTVCMWVDSALDFFLGKTVRLGIG
jgi:hypothetical protein